LELNDCPSVAQLDRYYRQNCTCTNYIRPGGVTCAKRKVEHLWKWIKECERMSSIISQNSVNYEELNSEEED